MSTRNGPRAKARNVRWLWLALLCVVGLVVAGCGGDDDSSSSGGSGGSKSGKPILVGAAVALTGDEAPFDEPPMQAFKQAADEVNAKGGINGRKLNVVIRDMKSDPKLAARVTTDLVNKGAELVITPCDPDLGAPGAIVAQQKGIISFSLCEASARFGPQGIGKYVYTPSHITYLEGYVMAEWAKMKRNLSKAFVIEDKTFAGYDGEVCKGFRNRWKELGGQTVGSDTLSSDDKSIAATVTRIKSSNPEFIYMCSQPPGSPGWIRQIRAAGLNQPIMMATATDGSYWLKAVPNLNDVFYPSMGSIYGDDPNPRVNTFVKDFTQKQGHPPQTGYALFGAAVMDLWKKAVEQAKTTDGEPVRKQLDSFQNVPTIVGATTYTDQSHIALDRPMLIMEVKDGKIQYTGETWKVKKAPTLTG